VTGIADITFTSYFIVTRWHTLLATGRTPGWRSRNPWFRRTLVENHCYSLWWKDFQNENFFHCFRLKGVILLRRLWEAWS